jgi:hypothetical protein
MNKSFDNRPAVLQALFPRSDCLTELFLMNVAGQSGGGKCHVRHCSCSENFIFNIQGPIDRKSEKLQDENGAV